MTNATEVAKMLTTDESAIVRALNDAVDEFFDVEVLSTSGVLAEKHGAVLKQFLALQAAFPTIAVQVADVWEDEFPEEPEFPAEGPSEALFELLFSLRAFQSSNRLLEFVRLEDELRNQIYDVKSYSENWDWERGVWK